MSVVPLGNVFQTSTESRLPEVGIKPDGTVFSITQFSNLFQKEWIDFDVYSADGELLSDGLIEDTRESVPRATDVAVGDDGRFLVLYGTGGGSFVRLFNEDGTPVSVLTRLPFAPNSSFLEFIDASPDGTFSVINDTAGATGLNGDTELSIVDANGQLGPARVYHEEDPDRVFAGQHDTQPDGTLLIARTETFFLPSPVGTFKTIGVRLDLVDGDTVNSTTVHVPFVADTGSRGWQPFDQTELGAPPQAIALAGGGIAVVYQVNVGADRIGEKRIMFFDDDGGNASPAFKLFEEGESSTLASVEFWTEALPDERVAIVWADVQSDRDLNVMVVSRTESGDIETEQATIATVAPSISFGLGSGVSSVNVGPDGSLYVTYRNTEGESVTQRVVFPTEGELALTGDAAANTLVGGSGADWFDGEGGNDQINAEDGNDRAYGGAGNDTLNGGDGDDYLSGGTGNDVLNGGPGLDTMLGGKGNDTYVVDNVGDVVTEAPGEGTDLVRSSISYTLGDNLENLRLISGPATTPGSLDGTGNALANAITGTGGANVLRGAGGNDTLKGAGGADTLEGGNGNDRLLGGGGNDELNGGRGNDFLNGGGGSDIIIGGRGSDTLVGGGGGDSMEGSGGSDVMNGGGGADTMSGGGGRDDMSGGAGNDRLSGGGGADTVDGGAGNDVLFGNGGNDVLIGGRGNDTMTGGGGRDDFVFAGRAGKDVITDFSIRRDEIDLSAYDITFDDLVIREAGNGADTQIRYEGGTIRLEGVAVDDVTEDVFIF